MIEMVTRKKIEVLVDDPLLGRLTEAVELAGIKAYTLLPVSAGRGSDGPWHDDQLSGAASKTLLVTITSEARAKKVIEALAPLLDDYGLVLVASDVQVVRGSKL